MNIANYDKAEVLAALYNRATPQGMSWLQSEEQDMTIHEAREVLATYADTGVRPYLDYLKGRVMKINMSHDEIDTRLYNRDNGKDAAEHVIEQLKPVPDPAYHPPRRKPGSDCAPCGGWGYNKDSGRRCQFCEGTGVTQ